MRQRAVCPIAENSSLPDTTSTNHIQENQQQTSISSPNIAQQITTTNIVEHSKSNMITIADTNSIQHVSSEATTLLNKAHEYITPPLHDVHSFMSGFHAFIEQGNVIDLAVGVILGKSFSIIIDSFVTDILSPILSLFSQRNLANLYLVVKCPPLHRDCTTSTWTTWQQARDAGAITLNYGQFAENIVNFIINALFLYIALKKVLEVLFQRAVTIKKECPFCRERVHGKATKCRACGSSI